MNVRLASVPLFVGLFAVSAQAKLLVDIYEAARLNDAQYRSDMATVVADKENLDIAKAAVRPKISISGSGTLSEGEAELSAEGIRDKKGNAWGYGLALNQSLFNRQAFKAYGEAKRYYAIAELRARQIDNELITKVVSLYNIVLQSQETIAANEADVANLKRQLTSAQDRLDVGLGTVIELNQARAQYSLALASLAQAESDLTIAEINLRRSAGYVPEQYEVLTDEAKQELESLEMASLDDWLVKFDASIEYQIASEQAQMKRKTAERISGQRWPVLNLFAEHSYSDSEDEILSVTSEDTSNVIGLRLEQSLYEGGSLSAQNRQAKLQLRAAELQRDAAYLEVRAQITSAYDALVIGQKRLTALREASEAAQSVLNAQLDSFDVGVASQNDVLDAQRTDSEARANYLKALYDQINIMLNLRYVVDELDVELLKEVDEQWYQPEESN